MQRWYSQGHPEIADEEPHGTRERNLPRRSALAGVSRAKEHETPEEISAPPFAGPVKSDATP
jgi:hypothetical protein